MLTKTDFMQLVYSNRNFYLYVVMNDCRSRMEVGTTGDLTGKLHELEVMSNHEGSVATGQNNCRHLIYWESFEDARGAMERELELGGWSKRKLRSFIESKNPGMRFLNEEIYSDYYIFLRDK